MAKYIGDELAKQVADTVKDVCGKNINFINEYGIIFASTDSKRLGTFHEIGQKAAATGQVIEVDSDDRFTGTHKGINLPVYYNNDFLAVVGISGEPDEVRKYAHLAERITVLLVKEKELNTISHNRSERMHHLLDSLVRNAALNPEYLQDTLTEFQINSKTNKRLILIKLNRRYNLTNLSMLDYNVYNMFQIAGFKLFTFRYPDEYVAVVDAEEFLKKEFILNNFAKEYKQLFRVVVGKEAPVSCLHESYHSAKTVLRSFPDNHEGYLLYDDLTLDILFSRLTEQDKQTYHHKTIEKLSNEDLALLRVYFKNNLSLTRTSEELFLHKNTVQYKLNVIAEKCGLNPRQFQDGVLLYLAVILNDR